MNTYVLRLLPPRPTFATDMTDSEREMMGRHAAHWQSYVESGRMVVFGPVLEGGGGWGLGVVEADDDEEIRTHAAADPAVQQGLTMEVGTLLTGFVRPS